MLKYHMIFDSKTIHAYLLPVGNPATTFKYGIIPKNKKVCFTDKKQSNEMWLLTIYNCTSIPIFWFDISTIGSYETPEFNFDSFYIIRIIRCRGSSIDAA